MKHEVELRTRQAKNKSYTEILTFIDSGKAYLNAPDVRLPQAPQKGPVCWYNAFLNIRNERYGKDSKPHANRLYEKTVSDYRKTLSTNELLNTWMKNFFTLPFGLNELKMSTLDQDIEKKFETVDRADKTSFLDDQSLFFYSQTYLIRFTSASEEEKAKLQDELNKKLFGDLFPLDDINKTKALSFFEIIFFIKKLMSLADKGDYVIGKLKNRMNIFLLGAFKALLGDKNVDALSKDELIDYVHLSMNAVEMNTIYKRLNLTAPVDYFKQMLTTGVHNSAALSLLEQEAIKMASFVNSDAGFLLTKNVSYADIIQLKSYTAIAQGYLLNQLIDGYDLERSQWTPAKGFSGLTDAINTEGALVFCGKNIGLPAYIGEPKTLMKHRTPVSIGTRTIKYWSKEQLQPHDAPNGGHAITVIGTQAVTKKEKTREYVFFLDPNVGSKPGEERTVFRMKYKDLAERITLFNGTKITSRDLIPENSVYAATAKNK